MRRIRGGPSGIVGWRRHRGRRCRGPWSLRPPASRPGIGRSGRERRRAADALQGPRPGVERPRRAATAEPPWPAGGRPLPLLDDRVDGVGERPADVSPRPSTSTCDRPQRQPREHARAARAVARRSCSPARLDGHRASDGAACRRARRRYRRRAPPRVALGPRRIQPRDPRRETGHRRPRPVWLPAARSRPASGPRGPGPGARPVGRRADARRLVPLVGDRWARHRRRRVRA